MSIVSHVKSLIPASSRSLHAMYHELGQMHGQMGEMWAEVGLTRIFLHEQFPMLSEQIRKFEQHLTDTDNRLMLMLWELYRRDGESLSEAKKRLTTSLSPATGPSRTYQLASAQLLFEFDAFCQEHDIVYWLVSGTLLGAVRHKGFIPWDDDLDVGMTRADIERLIDFVATNERFCVTVRYDYCVHCRQVRFRYADERVPCFIDLFYFDPVAHVDKDTFVAREAERASLEADLETDEELMRVWDVAHQFLDEGSPEAELARAQFDAHVGALYEQGVLVKSLDEAEGIIWGIDNVNSGVSHHTWYLIPRDAILPIGRMRFEGHDVNVPHDYNKCLTDIFDDIYDVPEKVGSYFNHLNADALRDPEVREVMESLAGEWRNANV